MSYPRKVHTLIVEDERIVTDSYRDIFRRLADQFELIEPRFAHSVDDAKRILSGPEIVHLLILDLGLPVEIGEKAMEGIEPGLSLMNQAAGRDDYPIPAVVVISGRLGIGNNLTDIHDQLSKSFWYGVLVSKGDDEKVINAISNALKAIHRYTDVGCHLRNSSNLCPTLSPREEDMLRRCALSQQPECLSIDLGWWGSYQPGSPKSVGTGDKRTKVLAGSFVLDGMGRSLTSFFKFKEADGASYARRDAGIMMLKLSHVKVVYSLLSSSRSLLVTQKVGSAPGSPISLSEFLQRPVEQAGPQIQRIVRAIGNQLDRLGDSGNEDKQEWPIKKLLWQHHHRDKLVQAWTDHSSEAGETSGSDDPLATYDHLGMSNGSVFVRVRRCTHGDLNATNIALDEVDENVEAYIFDAEGIHPDVHVRDFATLEVTSLLHHALDGGSLVAQCADFFNLFVTPPGDLDYGNGPPLVRNTRSLIAEIRRHAIRGTGDELVYAVVLFDVVLQQLGGLAWQRSGNKIVTPHDAAVLAKLAASWCMRIVNPVGGSIGGQAVSALAPT